MPTPVDSSGHGSGQWLRQLKDLMQTNAGLSDKTAQGLISLVSSPTMPAQFLDSPLSLCWARGVFTTLETAHSRFVGQGVCLASWNQHTDFWGARGVFSMLQLSHSHFAGKGCRPV